MSINKTYSLSIKAGESTTFYSFALLGRSATLTAVLGRGGGELVATYADDTISVTIPADKAIEAYNGAVYVVLNSGVRVLQGIITVIPAPTVITPIIPPSSGSLTIIDSGLWKNNTTYAAGQVVTYVSGRYLTPLGSSANSAFDFSQWILLGSISNTI